MGIKPYIPIVTLIKEHFVDFSTIMKDEKLKETRTITEWLAVQDAKSESFKGKQFFLSWLE